jgi:hypothetical protein
MSCENATDAFLNQLVHIYKREIDNNVDEAEISESILNWINTGNDSEYVDKLLSSPSDNRIAFPIWWSGFFVENPNPKDNPTKDMKEASLIVNGYSSIDTLMTSLAFNEQNNFWKQCFKKENNFKWGEYISKTYTKLALKNNPRKIGLFVNKDGETFKESFFYTVEFDLIKNRYNETRNPVTLYIFNIKKETCDDIKTLLEAKLQGNNEYITFECIQCDKLPECANKIQQDIQTKSPTARSRSATARSKSRTRSFRGNATIGGKKRKTRKFE